MKLFGLTAAQSKMLVLIIVAVIAMASISYALVVYMGNSQVPKVTWMDSYGAVIQSVTLSFTSPGSTSVNVSFICNQNAGPVSLKLAGLAPTVSVSQTNFATCGSTPDHVTITATSSSSINLDGTLHVTQVYNNYRTLAVPLAVNVAAS